MKRSAARLTEATGALSFTLLAEIGVWLVRPGARPEPLFAAALCLGGAIGILLFVYPRVRRLERGLLEGTERTATLLGALAVSLLSLTTGTIALNVAGADPLAWMGGIATLLASSVALTQLVLAATTTRSASPP